MVKGGGSFHAGRYPQRGRFCKSRLKLHEGDWIVMLSDGMLLGGSEWIFDQIKLSAKKSAEELAQDLWQTAQKRKPSGHDDDASVMVCKVIEKP